MKMYRMLVFLVAMLMVLTCGFATAEQSEDDEAEWFELGGDKRTVTVRVPSYRDSTCEWSYTISNENALELLTSEDTALESADKSGVFAASFISTTKESGDVAVVVSYGGKTGSLRSYTLNLTISENGEIAITGHDAEDEWKGWLTLTDDDCVISVSMPVNATAGYAWRYDISSPELVALTSESYTPIIHDDGTLGSSGIWSAIFEGAQKNEGDGGDVTLTFNCQRGDRAPDITCVAELWLAENGQFEIVSETATYNAPADAE